MIGSSQSFVLGQGFQPVGQFWGLLDSAGQLRLLAELTCTGDLPEALPAQGFQALLASLQPGWMLRLLQMSWPDPAPRRAFSAQVSAWPVGHSEGLDLLQQGLQLALQSAPLPYLRRLVLEFALPGAEGLAWWEGLPGLLERFGLQMRLLGPEEIQDLARALLNPELELTCADPG